MASKRITPHTLRHACALHTLEATGDIRKVSLWLGHASIRSTEIYLRSDPIGKLGILADRLPPSISKGSFPDAPGPPDRDSSGRACNMEMLSDLGPRASLNGAGSLRLSITDRLTLMSKCYA